MIKQVVTKHIETLHVIQETFLSAKCL